jgi:hypothetical protein
MQEMAALWWIFQMEKVISVLTEKAGSGWRKSRIVIYA